MGKAYKRTGPPALLQQASGPPQSPTEEDDTPAPQHQRVDLGDGAAIKRMLDDVAAQVRACVTSASIQVIIHTGPRDLED